MEQPRSSSPSESSEKPSYQRLSRRLSRTALVAAALLGVTSATSVKAIADDTGHQVIAIVTTGLKLGSDTKIDTIICKAKGPEISCTVHENSDERMPVSQDLHGHWLFQLFPEGKGKDGETLPAKFVVKDRNADVLSEDYEITGDIFAFDEGLPFAESKMIVLKGDMVEIFNPSLSEEGIPQYTMDSSFSQKEVIGEGWLAGVNKGKVFGMSKLLEDKGKEYFVVLEKKDGTWQITEKHELPEGSNPWNFYMLDNYPGGPKIGVADFSSGFQIFESGNMKNPVQIFQYPEDEIFAVDIHPNGKFLIASGLGSGFFIIDIKDPSNYTYIFGASGNYGFDEKGMGQNFLSYVEITNEKPLVLHPLNLIS